MPSKKERAKKGKKEEVDEETLEVVAAAEEMFEFYAERKARFLPPSISLFQESVSLSTSGVFRPGSFSLLTTMPSRRVRTDFSSPYHMMEAVVGAEACKVLCPRIMERKEGSSVLCFVKGEKGGAEFLLLVLKKEGIVAFDTKQEVDLKPHFEATLSIPPPPSFLTLPLVMHNAWNNLLSITVLQAWCGASSKQNDSLRVHLADSLLKEEEDEKRHATTLKKVKEKRDTKLTEMENEKRDLEHTKKEFDLEKEVFVLEKEEFSREKEEFSREKEEFSREKDVFTQEKDVFSQEKEVFRREKEEFSREKGVFRQEKEVFRQEKEEFSREKEKHIQDQIDVDKREEAVARATVQVKFYFENVSSHMRSLFGEDGTIRAEEIAAFRKMEEEAKESGIEAVWLVKRACRILGLREKEGKIDVPNTSHPRGWYAVGK